MQAVHANPDNDLAPEGDWQTVTLPDNWIERWPGYSGSAWYRITWQSECNQSELGLLIESIVMAGEVYVNGNPIWRDMSLIEPLSRSWNMPRFWRLSPPLVRDGENTLLIKVVGVAGQTPGLGPVHVGEAQVLQKKHDDLVWRNRTLFFINLTISAVMGAVFLIIWLINRKQTDYGWYALTALFWVLFATNIVATSPFPFPDTVMAAKANAIAFVLYVASFCMFTWRFLKLSMPRFTKALWSVATVLIVITATAQANTLKETLALAIFVPVAIFFTNLLYSATHALRKPSPEHLIIATCFLSFMIVGVYDLLLLLHVIKTGNPLMPLTSIATTLCLSGVLGLRHARNMWRIENFNIELEKGIGLARTELSSTLQREHELVLTNSVLKERLKLSRDLHDGLGSSLVRVIAIVQQAKSPLQNQQVLSLLKQIRDDLRQTIDAGSSNDVRVPASPNEWIAPLRHRFMQLFDDIELNATWEVPEKWLMPPNAMQCLALTRLVEEALTNIFKHSRAHNVGLKMWQPEANRLMLVIEDDGVGFDMEAVRQAGVSVGMRSMHARIAAVGGTLEVQSLSGRTTLTISLKMTTTNA